MHLWHISFIKQCVNSSNHTSDAASVSCSGKMEYVDTDLMVTALQFLIILTELTETM